MTQPKSAPAYPPAFLPLVEAARYVGLSASTIDDWRREGRIPSYKPCRVRLFAVADLDAEIRRHREDAPVAATEPTPPRTTG